MLRIENDSQLQAYLKKFNINAPITKETRRTLLAKVREKVSQLTAEKKNLKRLPKKLKNSAQDACKFSNFGCTVVSKDLLKNHEINCRFDPEAALENRCQACGIVIPKNHSFEQEPGHESQLMTSDSDSEQDWHPARYRVPEAWNTEPEWFARYHLPPEEYPHLLPEEYPQEEETGVISWVWGKICVYLPGVLISVIVWFIYQIAKH